MCVCEKSARESDKGLFRAAAASRRDIDGSAACATRTIKWKYFVLCFYGVCGVCVCDGIAYIVSACAVSVMHNLKRALCVFVHCSHAFSLSRSPHTIRIQQPLSGGE